MNIKQYLEKNRKSLLNILIILNIVFITLFTWRQLPNVTLRADGYQYLVAILWRAYFSPPTTLINYDQGSVLVGMLLGKLLGANVRLYYWASLWVMVVINITTYFLLLKVTKRKIVAFAGSIFLGVNYFSNWAMYAQGIYAFLQERVINMLLVLPALLFLHLFLEKRQRKYYVYSLIFYFFAVGLWHWTVIITAPFFLYPVLTSVFKREKISKMIKSVFIGLQYVLISVFFISVQQVNQAGIGPQEWTFTSFLLHPGKYNYFPDMLRQFIYLNSYPLEFEAFRRLIVYGEFQPFSMISDLPTIKAITLPVSIFYIFLTVYIYKTLPKMRAFLLTIIFSFVSVVFLNCYFGRYIVSTQAGANRYLFLPGFLFAFYWTLALWAIFWRYKSISLKYLGFGFLGIFCLLNIFLIDDNFKNLFIWDHSANVVISYVNDMKVDDLKDTLVVAPYPEFQSFESYFFTQYKGNKTNTRFIDNYTIYQQENNATWKEISLNYPHEIVLTYDKGCDCVKLQKLK